MKLFDKIFDGLRPTATTQVERLAQKELTTMAWVITKKAMMNKLRKPDIDKLEGKYKEYFKKFPNPKNEIHCAERIKKLRGLI